MYKEDQQFLLKGNVSAAEEDGDAVTFWNIANGIARAGQYDASNKTVTPPTDPIGYADAVAKDVMMVVARRGKLEQVKRKSN